MYKIIEWNINQATDKYNKNAIPSFIGEYINLHHPEILVLTEFCFTNNASTFLSEYLDFHNYSYFPNGETENKKSHQNEVLIAWRNDLFEVVEGTQYSEIVTYNNNRPNYVRICLRDKIHNFKFYIVGLRITVDDIEKCGTEISEKRRRQQFEHVLQDIDKFTVSEENYPMIMVGDFNCFRRGYKGVNWSLDAIKKLTNDHRFECRVPEGSSIYQKKSYDKEYEFPEDLIIYKNISVKSYSYDRRFTYLNPEVYLHGEDFSVYCATTKTTTWSIRFGSGIPDHAVMVAEVEF